MLTRFAQSVVVHDHQRKADAECGSVSLAFARRMHGAAVHLDDVSDDGEAQSQSGSGPFEPRIRLTKALEHVRQELRPNPHHGVAHYDVDVRVHAFDAHLDAAPLRRELHGIRQQIPHDLLQPVGIARYRADAWIDNYLQADLLRIGRRLHRRDGVVHDDRQLHRLHIKPNLASHDA